MRSLWFSAIRSSSIPFFGLGGEMYHQLGCWDYPIDEDKYQCLIASEMNMQGYYSNK